MSMPSAPGSGRGQPLLDQPAQDAIAALRGQVRWAPGYEPVPLSPEEQEEARKLEAQAQKDALVCDFCASVHVRPSSPACPRLASFELDGERKVRAGTFWAGDKWKRGRVVPAEDLYEDAGDGG